MGELHWDTALIIIILFLILLSFVLAQISVTNPITLEPTNVWGWIVEMLKQAIGSLWRC